MITRRFGRRFATKVLQRATGDRQASWLLRKAVRALLRVYQPNARHATAAPYETTPSGSLAFLLGLPVFGTHLQINVERLADQFVPDL